MPIVGCLFFGVIGITQIWAAYLGVAYYWGGIAAFVIIAASLFFQFSLPITIFSFLGALNVWEWPWWGAALFAAPGLIFMVPAVIAQISEGIRGKLKS